MKKVLLLTLMGITSIVTAESKYDNFQQFDKQVSFGMSSQNGNFSSQDAAKNPNQFSVTSLNLEVEYLTDMGLWWDFAASIAQTYTQSLSSDVPTGSYPYLQTMNAKIGYNIPLLDNFAIVPYLTLGKNTNLSTYNTIVGSSAGNNNQPPTNVTNDFFYTIGGGLRLELPINKYVQLYADQLVAANLDQTSYMINLTPVITPNVTPISASNVQWTTTLGVKVNPWERVQLGGSVFYTNYTGYNQSTEQSFNNSGMGLPTTSLGYQLSVGFTFK
jgi:hypothetical protein